MLSPLPLGGSYLVMAYRTMGQNILIQEPVPLDAANPIRTLELRLPPGKPARVKVVGPDGTPLCRPAVRWEPLRPPIHLLV